MIIKRDRAVRMEPYQPLGKGDDSWMRKRVKGGNARTNFLPSSRLSLSDDIPCAPWKRSEFLFFLPTRGLTVGQDGIAPTGKRILSYFSSEFTIHRFTWMPVSPYFPSPHPIPLNLLLPSPVGPWSNRIHSFESFASPCPLPTLFLPPLSAFPCQRDLGVGMG